MLVSGHHWLDALKHLGLMSLNQPELAIRFVETRLQNQAKRVMLFLRGKTEEELASWPLFAEVSPKVDLDQCEVWLRHNQKILDALTALDAELWRKTGQNQH